MLLEFLAKLFRFDSHPEFEIINGKASWQPAPRLLVFLAKLFRVDSNPKLAIPEDGKPTWEQVTGPRI
jgi:hypothetical protein